MRRLLLLFVWALCVGVSQQTLHAQSAKHMEQFNYVMKNLKLDNVQKNKFRPVLLNYYKEIEAIKKSHSALKNQLQRADELGKLTDAECDKLFNSKQKQELDELNVRKKYYEEFKKVLPVQKAYKAIRLSNDKVR